MEEKLLKAKELKELLSKLSKLNGYIKTTPFIDYTVLTVFTEIVGLDYPLHREEFHSYEDDPTKCQLAVLRSFFSLAQVEDFLACYSKAG